MGNISNYIPTPEDVKGIFSDNYKLFLKYKNIDILKYIEEINQECHEIEKKYKACECSAKMTELVLRLLIEYSINIKKYDKLP